MRAVIMAGGLGTRIRPSAPDLPKPMLPVAGRPVLEHGIRCLREQEFTDLVITVGYRASAITDYFGDGSGNGVRIRYYQEESPLGSGGALFRLRELLTEDFLLVNGDVLFDVDLRRFAAYHRRKGALATLFTHPNSHPYDSGLLIADESGAAEAWLTAEDSRPQWYRNRVNAGLHVLSPQLLEREAAGRVDLDREVLKPLCGTGKMFCYDSPEYVKDMGTPERYREVERDFSAGRVSAGNFARKQKAVFLDRDGTINRYVGFLKEISEFELLPGVSEAIRRINESGYLAIVATNQPVVARGEVTEAGLREIHNKMETLLGRDGAYIDAIYCCPHHPDRGFEGEVPGLKIDCDCRKPRPGLLLHAAEDYNIDLSESWMVGDGENDVKAGKAAGCRTALIGSGNYGQDVTVSSLAGFAEYFACKVLPEERFG